LLLQICEDAQHHHRLPSSFVHSFGEGIEEDQAQKAQGCVIQAGNCAVWYAAHAFGARARAAMMPLRERLSFRGPRDWIRVIREPRCGHVFDVGRCDIICDR